jgi:hypothetical protein
MGSARGYAAPMTYGGYGGLTSSARGYAAPMTYGGYGGLTNSARGYGSTVTYGARYPADSYAAATEMEA